MDYCKEFSGIHPKRRLLGGQRVMREVSEVLLGFLLYEGMDLYLLMTPRRLMEMATRLEPGG